MDRLLHFTLDKFVRRGAMTVTTASGETFTCGDGTGDPGAIMTRNYITREAARLRTMERGGRPRLRLAGE